MESYFERYPHLKPVKWPLWKIVLKHILDFWEFGDHEYVRSEFGRWPLKFWITVWEPRLRTSWFRRLFPWRIRCALEGLIRNWVWSACTICNRRFSLRELVKRDGSLMYFMSGSICHRECSDKRSARPL